MSILINILPWLTQVLLLAVVLTLLLGARVKDKQRRPLVIGALLALGLFLPIQGLSVAQWLRSALGDLSVLLMLLMANILLQRWFNRSLLTPNSRSRLLLGIAVVGVVFYPLALGVSYFDPYYMGYMPVLLPVLLVIASISAWLKSKRDLSIILLLPLIAHNLNLLESTNLWDYLLDPVLTIYALVQTLAGARFHRDKLTEAQRDCEKTAVSNRQ